MIAIDCHTHSVASGHAYSTLEEMARAASSRGLPGFVLTDHAPAMPGGAHIFHFYNLRILPRRIQGTLVFKGAEANILDPKGTIDLDDDVLANLEVVVASFHPPCFTPGSSIDHTSALLGAMKNPKITIIGHPDDSRYPYDIPSVVRAAGETGTLLEMNNTSLNPLGFRVGARENYQKILTECRKQGVSICVNSDAHFSSDVGRTDYAEPLLKELDFPRELVANRSLESFLEATGITL